MELDGRVAIVTGSSRGIGRATATELARSGARVVVNYKEAKQEAEQTAAELSQIGDVLCIQADVADETQVDRLVKQVVKTWGRIDILVNNAGILQDRTLRRMSSSEWQSVLLVNLGGTFNCSRAVLDHMVEARRGRIINISSVVAETGNFGQTNYSASKAGIIAFTKSLAQETAARGITVNAVAPGFIKTDMLKSIPENVLETIRARIPVGDFGEPADIAAMIGFLASDRARYITGQVFNVNGGLYM